MWGVFAEHYWLFFWVQPATHTAWTEGEAVCPAALGSKGIPPLAVPACSRQQWGAAPVLLQTSAPCLAFKPLKSWLQGWALPAGHCLHAEVGRGTTKLEISSFWTILNSNAILIHPCIAEASTLVSCCSYEKWLLVLISLSYFREILSPGFITYLNTLFCHYQTFLYEEIQAMHPAFPHRIPAMLAKRTGTKTGIKN